MDTIDRLLGIYRDSAGVSIDTRTLRPKEIFFALRGPNFDGNRYARQALDAGAAHVVVDADAENGSVDAAVAGDPRVTKVADALTALQDLARAYRRTLTCPVVALTGSNGKTTTKELLAAALAVSYEVSHTRGNLNNHIGVPLTLLRAPRGAEIVVVEMGANHRREIAALCEIAEPTHGLITNVGRAHLEGFGGEEGVRIGKGELFDYLGRAGGAAFVDAADATVAEMSERVARRLVFASGPPATPARRGGGEYLAVGTLTQAYPQVLAQAELADGTTLALRLQLPGHHNYRNAMAAVAVASYFKAEPAALAQALAAYAPRDSRSETRRVGRATVLLDAYNANPDSMAAALSWLSNRTERERFAVLGEMAELGASAKTEHAALLRRARESLGEGRVAVLGDAYRGLDRAQLDGVRVCADIEALRAWFGERTAREGAVVLVKGSRSNRLERLLD